MDPFLAFVEDDPSIDDVAQIGPGDNEAIPVPDLSGGIAANLLFAVDLLWPLALASALWPLAPGP